MPHAKKTRCSFTMKYADEKQGQLTYPESGHLAALPEDEKPPGTWPHHMDVPHLGQQNQNAVPAWEPLGMTDHTSVQRLIHVPSELSWVVSKILPVS